MGGLRPGRRAPQGRGLSEPALMNNIELYGSEVIHASASYSMIASVASASRR
jgi:hypothetical protein